MPDHATDARIAAVRTAVLLVNLGTPDAPTTAAVRRYLGEFLHDRRVVDLSRWLWCPILHGAILPLRSPGVARNYAKVWLDGSGLDRSGLDGSGSDGSRLDGSGGVGRGSPLRVHTQDLADAVQARLPELRVRMAMRYGNPHLRDALRGLRDEGLRRVLVVPLYPQYSATTTASVFDAVADEFARWNDLPELRVIRDYHRDDGWLDALATKIRALRGDAPGEKLLLSFHGIPERYVRNGDPYPRECEASAEALAQRLGLSADQWKLSYQSRFGREPWLGPATSDVLRDWARQGVRNVDVACPGFAVDCLETLEEIAMQNAEQFLEHGGKSLRYLPALNADAAHADALAALVRRHTAGWTGSN